MTKSKDVHHARTSVLNTEEVCWDVYARLDSDRVVVLSYVFPCRPSPELEAARAVVANLLSVGSLGQRARSST